MAAAAIVGREEWKSTLQVKSSQTQKKEEAENRKQNEKSTATLLT